MEHVEAFLKHIGLGQYAEVFEDNGYDSLDILFVMDESDFAIFGPYIGMKHGHLQRLQKTVFSMKKECSRAWEKFTADIMGVNVDPNTNNTVTNESAGPAPVVADPAIAVPTKRKDGLNIRRVCKNSKEVRVESLRHSTVQQSSAMRDNKSGGRDRKSVV